MPPKADPTFMKSFLKKTFLLFCIILFLSVTGFLILCYSSRTLEGLITFGGNRFQKEITIRKFTITKQTYDFPKKLTFQNVSLLFDREQEAYSLDFKTIELSGLFGLIFKNHPVALQAEGGLFETSAFCLEGLEVNLKTTDTKVWKGPVLIKKAKASGFEATNISGNAEVQSQKAVVSDIKGSSYRGKVTGRLTVHFAPDVRYEADIAFQDLDTHEMESINPSLFSQVRGQIYGTILIRGPAGGLETIQMNMQLGEGAELLAGVLQPLLKHIPKSTQRKEIQAAIKEGRMIGINDAALTLGNSDDKTVSTEILLKSKALNIDVDVKIDVNIEGGLQNLLKTVLQFYHP
ncbi:MAG: hypothetical protein ABIJ41_02070 [Candidatus Omnitrophota bacterium]